MSVAKELRALLAEELISLFEGWSLVQTAGATGLWPSEISALRNGRYAGFSIERLVRLLASQRYHIELTLRPIEPRPAPRVEPTIAVVRYDRFGRAVSGKR